MSDQLVRAISKDGFVKAAAVSTRELTERARQIHQDRAEADRLIAEANERADGILAYTMDAIR